MSERPSAGKQVHDIYKCNVCRRRFSSLLELLRHRDSHSEQRLFVCHVCNEKFICKRYLDEHMSIHSRTKTTNTSPICGLCYKRFSSIRDFDQHRIECILSNHGRSVSVPENAISLVTLDGGSTDKHVPANGIRQSSRKKKASSAIDSRNRIPAPSSDGTRRESVFRPNPDGNMSTHSGAEPLLCDACNEAFPSRDHLNEHRSQCILLNRRIPHCGSGNTPSSAALNGARADEHVEADDIKPSSSKEMLSVSNVRGNDSTSSSGGNDLASLPGGNDLASLPGGTRGEQRHQYQTRVAMKGNPMLKTQVPQKVIRSAKSNDKSCTNTRTIFPQEFNPLSNAIINNSSTMLLPKLGQRSETSSFSQTPPICRTSRSGNDENLPPDNLSVQRNSAEVSRIPSSIGGDAFKSNQRRSQTDSHPRIPGTLDRLRQGNALNFPPYYRFHQGMISPAAFMPRGNAVSNASVPVSQPCVEERSQAILRSETPGSHSSFRSDGHENVENPPSSNFRIQDISSEVSRCFSNIDPYIFSEDDAVLAECCPIPEIESDPLDINVHQYVTNRQPQERSGNINCTPPSWCICAIPNEEKPCIGGCR